MIQLPDDNRNIPRENWSVACNQCKFSVTTIDEYYIECYEKGDYFHKLLWRVCKQFVKKDAQVNV